MEPRTHKSALSANGQIRGTVLEPGDADYEDARRVWNATVDRRPAVIVRCETAADVIHAVNFARESGLLLSVRGGGHNAAGKAVCDGGVMIDLSPMRAVQVDPEARTARVKGGATWADVDRETQKFGLATPGGLISHTGVGGLTLGGGIGWLSRKYGLALDNVVAADVVTADGRLVRASDTEHPDLFWGLRGGGGNFGVVTAFEFRLHELGPDVLGGFVIHPMAAAAEALRFYREFMATAPDEVCCYPLFGTLPAQAPFPEAYQGCTALFFAACYAGPVGDAETVLQPLRAFGSPILDTIQTMPYTALQQSFDEAQKPGNRWYWKSSFWHELPDEAIATLVERVDPLSGALSMVFFESMGGAIGRVDAGATAFPHRAAPYNFAVTAGWTEAAEDEQHIAWVRELFAALEKYGSGVYVNYLSSDEDERTRAAFGDNYERLVAVKNEWDPHNLFRMNQNIRPTR